MMYFCLRKWALAPASLLALLRESTFSHQLDDWKARNVGAMPQDGSLPLPLPLPVAQPVNQTKHVKPCALPASADSPPPSANTWRRYLLSRHRLPLLRRPLKHHWSVLLATCGLAMKRTDCTICARQLGTSAFPILSPKCDHKRETCRKCWNEWLQSQIGTVPADHIACTQCTRILDQSDIKRLARPAAYEA